MLLVVVFLLLAPVRHRSNIHTRFHYLLYRSNQVLMQVRQVLLDFARKCVPLWC
eukprot:07738.XXX_109413_109574_1 [CDS] Oithona nana genome sequencing.